MSSVTIGGAEVAQLDLADAARTQVLTRQTLDSHNQFLYNRLAPSWGFSWSPR